MATFKVVREGVLGLIRTLSMIFHVIFITSEKEIVFAYFLLVNLST